MSKTDEEILEKAIQKALANYHIYPNGDVRSNKTQKLLKGSVNHKGYRYISIYMPEIKKSKKITVHKLVALSFKPNPDNLPHINHIDGNRLNNSMLNLEWCTASYNVSDGFNRGRVIWNKDNMSKERILGYAKKYPRQVFWYLTTNNFAAAKALWGEEKTTRVTYDIRTYNGRRINKGNWQPDWQYHLQQMVIAENPVEYLGENLPK